MPHSLHLAWKDGLMRLQMLEVQGRWYDGKGDVDLQVSEDFGDPFEEVLQLNNETRKD